MTMQKSKLINSLVAIVLLSGAVAGVSHAADKAPSPQVGASAAVSDEVVTSSAKAALSADPQAAALPVSVTTRKGVVVITGDVPSAAAGDRVVQLVASVAGVKEVKNELKVRASS